MVQREQREGVQPEVPCDEVAGERLQKDNGKHGTVLAWVRVTGERERISILIFLFDSIKLLYYI